MVDDVLGGRVGPTILRDGEPVLFFGGNDYLGLAGSRELEAAAVEAVAAYGVSSCASRTTTGTSDLHLELEEKLVRFRGAEAVRVIGAGYLANRILLSVLLESAGRVYCEQTVHPSARDGIPRGVADVVFFSRDDVAGFQDAVRTSSPGDVVLLDGVSTTGEIAPLTELMPIIHESGLRLLVDDAHGVGVLGERGRGTAASLGIDANDVVEAASMSKAFGSYGGYIAGPRDVIERIDALAPAYIGATALPPAVLGASIRAAEIIGESDDRRRRLRELTRRMQSGLSEAGYDVKDNGTPILIFGEGRPGAELHRRLRDSGILVPYIRYPDPLGPGRLRLTLSAGHTLEHVDQLLAAVREI